MTNTQLKSSEELDKSKSVQLVGATEEALQSCPVISRLLIKHSASLFMQKEHDLSYMDPYMHASRNGVFPKLPAFSTPTVEHCWMSMDE